MIRLWCAIIMCVAVLMPQVSQPMSLWQRVRGYASKRPVQPKPIQRGYQRGMSSVNKPESISRASSSMQSAVGTIQPQQSWSTWFKGLFGKSTTPVAQKPELSLDEKVAMNNQNNLTLVETKRDAELKAFKKGMRKLTQFIDTAKDSHDIDALANLIERNTIFINAPIVFEDYMRELKKKPVGAITILDKMLRTLVCYADDTMFYPISEWKFLERSQDVWDAQIELTKNIFVLGGNLGENPQESLFEILKRKAIIEGLFPTVYEQYFKNNINTVLKEVAAIHRLNYDLLEKDAHAAVAHYVFKEKTKIQQADNDLKNLLDVKEIPTDWRSIAKILRDKNIIQKPLKEVELKKRILYQDDLGFKLVIATEVVAMLKRFYYAHRYDEKYRDVADDIKKLFIETASDDNHADSNIFMYSRSPKLIEPSSLYKAYKVLNVNAQTPWRDIVLRYEKLLTENDPTYEANPVQRAEKEVRIEEIIRAFKELEVDRERRKQELPPLLYGDEQEL